MRIRNQTISSLHRQRLQALCALSDFPSDLNIESLVSLIAESPDPETASRMIMSKVTVASDAIKYKWRQEVADVWSAQNPHVPLLLDIPLSTSEVRHAPILADVHAFLREIDRQPADLVDEDEEQLLQSEEVFRLASALPSLSKKPIFAVESEWGCMTVRRLHVLLKTMRLVRSVKGKLVIVRSRYNRFSNWPLMQQLYVLWHADTYHVNWSDFAGQWGQYMNVLQDYLALLWDIGDEVHEGAEQDSYSLCSEVMDYFMPIWEEAGLFVGHDSAFLSVFQQCGLPGVVEKMVVNDILEKHGFIVRKKGRENKYIWTKLGVVFMETELTQDFPCGLSLLDA